MIHIKKQMCALQRSELKVAYINTGKCNSYSILCNFEYCLREFKSDIYKV